MLVPADKRQKLIANYKTDQEIYKNPSDEYIRVLLDIDAWCKEQNMRLGRVV